MPLFQLSGLKSNNNHTGGTISFSLYKDFLVPEFQFVEEVESDLDKHEQMWGMFEEFNRELRDMSKEEWIIFRFVLLHLGKKRCCIFTCSTAGVG